MSISTAQLKEARRLLGWTLSTVGGKSDLSTSTLSFFETDRRRPSALDVSKIRKAFEAAGVDFIAENGDGPGVRLRKEK
jgi:transcriptional regulator with XRE-family HTH domain